MDLEHTWHGWKFYEIIEESGGPSGPPDSLKIPAVSEVGAAVLGGPFLAYPSYKMRERTLWKIPYVSVRHNPEVQISSRSIPS